jgi:hypothetical protein
LLSEPREASGPSLSAEAGDATSPDADKMSASTEPITGRDVRN